MRKARLVAGGHAIDSISAESCSSVVQLISARTLLVVAAKHELKIASGDVGNAFPHAEVAEKVHAVVGPKFGEREGCKVEVIKKMHGMAARSRSWSLHFGDFIRSLGFVPARADPDT